MMAALRRLWAWWKPKAHAIGVFQTQLFLTVFYVLLFAPVTLLVRCVGDPLKRSLRSDQSAWRPRATRDRTREDLARQSS